MGKTLSVYGIIILYVVLSATVLTAANVPLYNVLVNPLIWVLIAGYSYYLARDNQARVKKSYDKTQSLIIAMIIYIIVYFCIGLFAGFQKTPYAKDLISIIKNIWSFGGIIVFEEITRNSLVRMNKKSISNLIIITFLFILAQINFISLFATFNSLQTAFTYISSIIIPIIAGNMLFTYLSYLGGTKLPIIYRFFVSIPPFIVPIIPDLNWFLTAVVGVTVPLIVYVYLNYINVKNVERLGKRRASKYSPVTYVPVLTVLIVAVLFVVGAFKYQPVAVLSGSMSPYFNRGDAVIINKLSDSEKDNLKKGDVIQFISGGRYVIHRIISVEEDNNLNRVFITKGDFNNVQDSGVVEYDQVVGKLVFIVPFIGYPSVWLNEIVQ